MFIKDMKKLLTVLWLSKFYRQKDFVKRFHAEEAPIAKLDHPNIVRIYYSGEDQGNYFFVMQYVEGESLADLLFRRKRLNVDESLAIIE
jgi:serine/threonine protein kinase